VRVHINGFESEQASFQLHKCHNGDKEDQLVATPADSCEMSESSYNYIVTLLCTIHISVEHNYTYSSAPEALVLYSYIVKNYSNLQIYLRNVIASMLA